MHEGSGITRNPKREEDHNEKFMPAKCPVIEVLADEQQATAIGFMSRAVAWFNGQAVECRQVMSDNGPAYLSRRFAKACKVLSL
jgi:hypothetical protein